MLIVHLVSSEMVFAYDRFKTYESFKGINYLPLIEDFKVIWNDIFTKENIWKHLNFREIILEKYWSRNGTILQ